MNNLYPPRNGATQLSNVSSFTASSSPNTTYDPRMRLGMTRTPSPTPSEVEILNKKGFGSLPRLRDIPKYFHRKYIGTLHAQHLVIISLTGRLRLTVNWIVVIFLLAVTIVSIALHNQIVSWLRPFGNEVKA